MQECFAFRNPDCPGDVLAQSGDWAHCWRSSTSEMSQARLPPVLGFEGGLRSLGLCPAAKEFAGRCNQEGGLRNPRHVSGQARMVARALLDVGAPADGEFDVNQQPSCHWRLALSQSTRQLSVSVQATVRRHEIRDSGVMAWRRAIEPTKSCI